MKHDVRAGVPMLRFTVSGTVEMPVRDGDSVAGASDALAVMLNRYVTGKGAGAARLQVVDVAVAAPRAEP